MTRARRDVPPPLTVAASLAAVEGLVLVLLGAAELAATSSGRVAMGVTTSLFFAAFGAALLYFAWSLTRGRSWARSPVVLAQLIQLGVAWSFRESPTTLVAVVLAVAAVVVIVGLLHPASIEHLDEEAADTGS